MEKQIKTTIPQLDDDKKEDDKDTVRYLMYIFIPLIIITILCFRYHTLRIIVLNFSGFFMCYSSYKNYKAGGNKFDKEILWQVLLIGCTVLAIFIKFFGDLVLSYIALLLASMLLMFALKLVETRQKISFNYYVFFGSIITAIILNYNDILLLFQKVINYFQSLTKN